MSEPFIAEIRIFAGNFAPRGWAFCDGQLLPIANNTTLFSLIGTTYGGDGRTTVALPNMEGRAPMHPGRGPGLTSRRLGERIGSETSTLTEATLPQHTHTLRGTTGFANEREPSSTRTFAQFFAPSYSNNDQNLVDLAFETLPEAGGGQAHNNMQPYITLNFIIALVGLYPSRD
ncbi:phage tail protein [Woodsholea maritima]|uniref:phage tail protein n=1 Tax=Woodsholea maritima TaxID=240237 RepID=UPI00036275CF|nr:tail fiber protein [Woodsholea maritima]